MKRPRKSKHQPTTEDSIQRKHFRFIHQLTEVIRQVKGRHLSTFLLLYLLAFVVYIWNGRSLPAIDTAGARHMALSLVRDGDLDIREALLENDPLHLKPVTIEVNGRVLSVYPAGPAIVAAPFFAIGQKLGLRGDLGELASLEKFAAANLAALCASTFWLVLLTTGAALIVRLICWLYFAFGTTLWVPSSLGLWQHGPLQLMLCAALLAWLLGNSKALQRSPSLFLAGLFIGLAGFMRPTALLLLPLWGALALWRYRIRCGWFIAGAIIGCLPLALYHLYYFGSVFGGGYFGHIRKSGYFERANPALNVLNYLFSPSRGLFIYSPFALLAILPAWTKIRKATTLNLDYLLLSLSGTALFALLLAYKVWWGGYSYGPRLMADLMPFVTLLTVPSLAWLLSPGAYRLARTAVVLLMLLWSIAVQALGAFRYDAEWDNSVKIDEKPQAAWNFKNSQLEFYLTGGRKNSSEMLAAPEYLLPPNKMISIGKPENHKYIHSGFLEIEPWGVWSQGGLSQEIIFHVPGIRSGELRLAVVAHGNVYAPARFKLFVNGNLCGTPRVSRNAHVKWEETVITCEVKAEFLTGGHEFLEIKNLDPAVPSAAGRYTGYGLSSLGWFPDADLF